MDTQTGPGSNRQVSSQDIVSSADVESGVVEYASPVGADFIYARVKSSKLGDVRGNVESKGHEHWIRGQGLKFRVAVPFKGVPQFSSFSIDTIEPHARLIDAAVENDLVSVDLDICTMGSKGVEECNYRYSFASPTFKSYTIRSSHESMEIDTPSIDMSFDLYNFIYR